MSKVISQTSYVFPPRKTALKQCIILVNLTILGCSFLYKTRYIIPELLRKHIATYDFPGSLDLCSSSGSTHAAGIHTNGEMLEEAEYFKCVFIVYCV